MAKIKTSLMGYEVAETASGLDVTLCGEPVCELAGRTFLDYSYGGVIDDSKIEDAILDELTYICFMREKNVPCRL